MMTSDLLQSISNLTHNIAWLFLGYIVTCCALILIRIVYKLRNEVFNEHLKIKPSHDQVILITGATSGIGLALARFFYRKGFSIIATRLSENEPDYLTELMSDKRQQQKIFFINLDVRFQESIQNSHDEVRKILKDNNFKLHALINNAGVAYNFTTNWSTREQLATTVQVNFLGPILMVRQYTSLLAQNPGSRLVFVGSINGKVCTCSASYCATKAGLTMFSNSLSLELRNLKIKSSIVHVGNILKNTAILLKTAIEAERVNAEFTEEEREMYNRGNKFEKHVEELKKSDTFIGRCQGANINGNSNDIQREINLSFSSKLLRLFSYIIGAVDSRSNLEDSYLMKSFENAVCLRSPSNDYYGGNIFYTIVVAGVLESLSVASFRDISYLFSFCTNGWQA